MALPTPEKLAESGSEDAHQAALFCWSALPEQQERFPEFKSLLFAIPNGGKRDKVTAARLKATGTKAGTPDLFLAVPRGPFHGLFIEMKKFNGVAKTQQLTFSEEATKNGYASYVIEGWKAVRNCILWYMQQ